MDNVPPVVHVQPPKVIWWFKVYAGFMCGLYLITAGFSLIFFLADPAKLEIPAITERAIGALLLVLGLAFFGAFLLPFIAKPRPWLWTYDLVLICIGMTGACILPASVPLLIYWLRPEAKAYFRKS